MHAMFFAHLFQNRKNIPKGSCRSAIIRAWTGTAQFPPLDKALSSVCIDPFNTRLLLGCRSGEIYEVALHR